MNTRAIEVLQVRAERARQKMDYHLWMLAAPVGHWPCMSGFPYALAWHVRQVRRAMGQLREMRRLEAKEGRLRAMLAKSHPAPL